MERIVKWNDGAMERNVGDPISTPPLNITSQTQMIPRT